MSGTPRAELSALLQLTGLSAEQNMAERIFNVADALIHRQHAFSADPDWQADSPKDRLRKGLLALATFELHFWQFMEASIIQANEQIAFVYQLILEASGLRGSAIRPGDVRTVLLNLRARRRRWLNANDKTGKKTHNKHSQTLLDLLDRGLLLTTGGRKKRVTHHDMGRLPMMVDKDWPRHLATRLYQVSDILKEKDKMMSSILPKRVSNEQHHKLVSTFFTAYDNVDEQTRDTSQRQLHTLPQEVVEVCKQAVWQSVSVLEAIQKPHDGLKGVKVTWARSMAAVLELYQISGQAESGSPSAAASNTPRSKPDKSQKQREAKSKTAAPRTELRMRDDNKAKINETRRVLSKIVKDAETFRNVRKRLRSISSEKQRRSSNTHQTPQRISKRPKKVPVSSPSEPLTQKKRLSSSSPMFVPQDAAYPSGDNSPPVPDAHVPRNGHQARKPQSPMISGLTANGDAGDAEGGEFSHGTASAVPHQRHELKYIHATTKNWLYITQGFPEMLDLILGDRERQ